MRSDAKHSPQGLLGNEVAGVGNATSGSLTDQLTRQHRMTLDEAHLILNVKRGEDMAVVLKVSYDDDLLGVVFDTWPELRTLIQCKFTTTTTTNTTAIVVR
jgi:hypothetical protein